VAGGAARGGDERPAVPDGGAARLAARARGAPQRAQAGRAARRAAQRRARHARVRIRPLGYDDADLFALPAFFYLSRRLNENRIK
jgi:hypothetical protein